MVKSKDIVIKEGSKRNRFELIDLGDALKGRKKTVVVEKTKVQPIKKTTPKTTTKVAKPTKKPKNKVVESPITTEETTETTKEKTTIKLIDSFKLNASESNEQDESFILTKSARCSVGSVWSLDKIQNIGNGFECEFKFQITESVGGGDGFAFVIQDSPNGNNAIGGIGNDIGYGGMINGLLAVEFDTYHNKDKNEPTNHHVSIQSYGCKINKKLYSHHKYSLGYHEFKENNLNDGKIRSVKITYSPTNKSISVNVDNVTLLNNIQLKLKLPNSAFIGFTAATGYCYQKHIVKDCKITC